MGNNFDSKRVRDSAYIWNSISGLLTAFQSVILLIVITRVCDLAIAGVFTIAYAFANQFLIVGKFGMRNFQATDVVPKFSFGDYAFSRALSTVVMLLCVAAYLVAASFSLEYSLGKTVAILLMCLLKGVDALEDVFFGNYQQNGKLGIAGRLMTLRVSGTIISLCLGVVISRSLNYALAVSFIVSVGLLIGVLLYAKKRYKLPAGSYGFSMANTLQLFKDCTPLFLSSFLIYYIGSAPKYAIDALAGDTVQAVYGFIAMPVFVITLFSSFMYAPIVSQLSHLWHKGELKLFVRKFATQALWVLLITFACVLLAWLAGAPVLSLMFNTDVSSYVLELCLLVASGGFMAFVSLFTVGVTIFRQQRVLLWGYGAVALFAFLGSSPAVRLGGITGASWIYLLSMGLLFAYVLFCFIFTMRQQKRAKLL